MKSNNNLLEQLKSSPFFNKNSVFQLGDKLGLKKTSIDTYISRYLKRKEIIQLKNGLYVTTDFYDKKKSDISYLFYLANIIRTPSYVSSWAALQYYGVVTEVVKIVTSVTPKVSRTYHTKAGTFSYHSIQKALFNNFTLIRGGFDFFIAEQSKALFDVLYFKTHQFRGVQPEDISKLINELRIDIDEIDKTEVVKFHTMVNRYFHE